MKSSTALTFLTKWVENECLASACYPGEWNDALADCELVKTDLFDIFKLWLGLSAEKSQWHFLVTFGRSDSERQAPSPARFPDPP